MRDSVDGDTLRDAFSESSEQELGEAIAELSVDSLVEVSAMGSDVTSFRPNLELYLTFDGIAFGTDPLVDARTLAEMALACEYSVDVEALFKATGWTLRRFNPSIEYVASQLSNDRVSRYHGTSLAVDSFFLIDEDRVVLKRFIKRLKG